MAWGWITPREGRGVNDLGPLLVFGTSEGRYAVPARHVRQVLGLVVFSGAGNGHGGWIGDAHVGEEVVPVLDVDLCFGRRPEAYTLDHRLVDVEAGDRRFALVATEVHAIVSAPEDTAIEASHEAPIRGAIRLGERSADVLELEALAARADSVEPTVSVEDLFSGFDEGELAEPGRRRDPTVAPMAPPVEPERLAVLASLAGNTVALLVDPVQEFVRLGRLTPVPTTPDHVLGLANHRGEIVGVVDLAPLLGFSPVDRRDVALAALVDPPSEPAAVAVDEVRQTVPLDEGSIDGSPDQPGVLGQLDLDGQSVPVVDPLEVLAARTMVRIRGA